MRTYKFSISNGEHVIEIVAESFTEAKRLLKQRLQEQGLL